MKAVRAVSIGLLLLAAAGKAQAQDSVPPAPAEEEERSTGLPGKVDWEFNFDAGLGTFGFSKSLYTNSRPDPSGDLSDNWAESYLKPALSGTYGLGTGALYGKVSAVGERTFAAPPTLVGNEASSFQVEDLYVGWRSGTALDIGENALDFTVGRTQYKIGTGFLLWDGGGEGGSGAGRARPGSLPASHGSSRSGTPSRASISTGTRSRRARPAPECSGPTTNSR